MIDTDETGSKKMGELVESIDSHDWNDWERNFLEDIQLRDYSLLSPRQKSIIGRLYDDLIG